MGSDIYMTLADAIWSVSLKIKILADFLKINLSSHSLTISGRHFLAENFWQKLLRKVAGKEKRNASENNVRYYYINSNSLNYSSRQNKWRKFHKINEIGGPIFCLSCPTDPGKIL